MKKTMASEHGKTRREEERKDFSIQQLDPSFYTKIMARNSSVGSSSTAPKRLSYYRASGKVPLNWELQPGKPRDHANTIESVTPTIIRPWPDATDDAQATAVPRTKFSKKLKKKKVKLGKRLGGFIPKGSNDGGQSSSSDEDDDFGFSASDVDESRPSTATTTTVSSSNTRSSLPSSPRSFRSPTCAVPSPNVVLHGMAKGLLKWAIPSKLKKRTK